MSKVEKINWVLTKANAATKKALASVEEKAKVSKNKLEEAYLKMEKLRVVEGATS